MADIDPAAVMAAHPASVEQWDDGEGNETTFTVCQRCSPGGAYLTDWPCEPYRLAEALADEQRLRGYLRQDVDHWSTRAEAAERALAAEQAKVADAWDEGREAEFRAGGRHAQPINPYRAALADQPEQGSDRG